MKRYLWLAVFFITVVTSLSFFDYFTLREQGFSAGPTLPPSLVISDIPTSASVGHPINFNWRIESATPRTTDHTTVYWAQQSSPSALTVLDSPAAVGYPGSLPDYSDGLFSLPSDFSASVTFDRPQTIFFRYYGHIDGQHLWSPEHRLDIN